jgi:hypothetical protein
VTGRSMADLDEVPAHRVEQEKLRLRFVQEDKSISELMLGTRKVCTKGVAVT